MDFPFVPPLFVLAGWVVLAAAMLALAHLRGTLPSGMLPAVDKAGPPDPEISREAMAKGFVWIGVVWFALLHGAAGLTLYLSLRGSMWATVGFFALAAWSLYEAASSPWVLGRMYPGSIGGWHWAESVLGSLVWLYLIAAVVWSRFLA